MPPNSSPVLFEDQIPVNWFFSDSGAERSWKNIADLENTKLVAESKSVIY